MLVMKLDLARSVPSATAWYHEHQQSTSGLTMTRSGSTYSTTLSATSDQPITIPALSLQNLLFSSTSLFLYFTSLPWASIIYHRRTLIFSYNV
jgi:hypothetical protein